MPWAISPPISRRRSSPSESCNSISTSVVNRVPRRRRAAMRSRPVPFGWRLGVSCVKSSSMLSRPVSGRVSCRLRASVRRAIPTFSMRSRPFFDSFLPAAALGTCPSRSKVPPRVLPSSL